MPPTRHALGLPGTELSRRGVLGAVLAAVGTAGVSVTERASPRVASSQDLCAEGSEVTEITYLGRREDGQHLVRARWRLKEWPQDALRCSSGTRFRPLGHGVPPHRRRVERV